ncbi:MAG: response regulator [Anaerolineales bacterium]|nr:response regulator [Anaerolineales bacterium]
MNETPYLLVVEDIPNILTLIDTALKFKGGYRVVTALNGEDAMQAIEKERPAVIVTDILMPRMDGFSLVHKLRLNPETRNIPVIFLSATYVAPEDKAFATLIGATRFLEKPIDIDHLMQTISELLDQKHAVAWEPLREFEFYEGYRKRLMTKLDQKNTQIARIERLLPTMSGEERNAFASSLLIAVNERDEIRRHLDQINEQIETFTKSGKTDKDA